MRSRRRGGLFRGRVCRKVCEVLDGRGTGEGDAVSATGEHGAQTSAIEILGNDGLVCRDYIDARAGLFECFESVRDRLCARQQDVETAQLFFAAGKLAERGKHAFRR